MVRKYIVRDPRTGKQIRSGVRGKTTKDSIRSLSPGPGPWERLLLADIVPLASGRITKVEVPADEGSKWKLGRIDAIKALHKVLESDVEQAHGALIEALDDDYPDVRIAGLKSLPSRSGGRAPSSNASPTGCWTMRSRSGKKLAHASRRSLRCSRPGARKSSAGNSGTTGRNIATTPSNPSNWLRGSGRRSGACTWTS